MISVLIVLFFGETGAFLDLHLGSLVADDDVFLRASDDGDRYDGDETYVRETFHGGKYEGMCHESARS